MVGLYKLLLLLLLLLPAHWIAESKLDAIPTKFECENYMPTFVTNLTCVLKSNNRNQTVIDADFFVVRELNNTSVLLSFRAMIGLNVLEEHAVTRIIQNAVRKSGNILSDCPYQKNKHYYVHDFKVDGDLIPQYVPEMNWTLTGDLFINRRKTIRFVALGRVVKVRNTSGRVIP
ncbi:uncharacterized protein LOC115626542 [Scaptodrosophila lebanonensis]|uniref:Uncharacterized protein LOC115626542 n=1 Tax=Drosophila lebanonensis TaxID=7225 RepID=A0A6J2TQJ4_DROLE|nr:uncharacterized protein LOC115626542 [Scaptodrosophila lebanonensis]